MGALERQLAPRLAGRLAILVEDVGVAPLRPRVGQQAARRQRHEQRAAEIIVAIGEAEPPGGGDPAGLLPGGQGGAPQAETLAIAMRAPEVARPWIGFAPGVDDAAGLGVVVIATR